MSDPKIQGEGDYEAGRRYDEKTREFVRSGRVEQAARDAAPKTTREAEEMRDAEREGRSHARDDGSRDDAVRGGSAG